MSEIFYFISIPYVLCVEYLLPTCGILTLSALRSLVLYTLAYSAVFKYNFADRLVERLTLLDNPV